MTASGFASDFDALGARLDALLASADAALAASAVEHADGLLAIGEAVLERWIVAKGGDPTPDAVEGFRLLALHRQGARGDPSFNACRETCRELVYHRNLICAEPAGADAARQLRLAAMVARHLLLFINGKLEVSGLGEFCCSSRPLRLREAGTPSASMS
jgi:hypothetical protein